MSKGWYGVDFDGTLAFYDRWRGEEHLGKPIPRMVKFVQTLLQQGKTVKIFTARVSHGNIERQKQLLGDWSEEHIGQRLEATCVKDMHLLEFYDDRAVQVVLNTGRRVVRKKEEQ